MRGNLLSACPHRAIAKKTRALWRRTAFFVGTVLRGLACPLYAPSNRCGQLT